jgi:hypothetical protein
MTEGAAAALSNLNSLRHFRSCRNAITFPINTLVAIGGKLWSLGTSCDLVEKIIRHCPNIRYLGITMGEEKEYQRICRSFKEGLSSQLWKVCLGVSFAKLYLKFARYKLQCDLTREYDIKDISK